MPHFSLTISPRGPLLQVLLGVSAPRGTALTAAGQPVPAPIPITGLIDTGASCTSIDISLLRQLAIPETGKTTVHTPSTQANAPHSTSVYDISLVLVHPLTVRTFNALPVIEAPLIHQGIQALIGRDILSHCLFVYDGQSGNFSLSL
jgi:hypothetical protein